MISCKKATMLMTVRGERPLTQTERLQMRLHLAACSLCRMYQSQTSIIKRAMGIPGESVAKMDESKKEQIRKLLSDNK